MLFRFRYDFTFYDHDHESLYFRYKNSDELVMIIISDGACSDEKSQRWLQQTKKRIHQEQNCAVQQGELVAVINNETWASLQFFKWMQWWCSCGGWSFKAWKKESYSLYDELGLRFASLASLGWGHSQLSREFVCLWFRHFLKISPDIFITYSETSSNYLSTLIVSINNKKIGQIKE